MERLVFKSYEDLVCDVKNNLFKISGLDFDLVVGIPRSGMIPAYLISAYLNLDCTDVDSLIENRLLQKGITRNTKGKLIYPHDANKILLVDDSIYSGESLKSKLSKLPSDLMARTQKLAIYASPESLTKLDIWFQVIDGLKLFEWGIYHNNIIHKTCLDLDGVICKDPLPEDNDDGEKYLNFIRNAEPKFIPTGEVYAIVTNRLEKYRFETEKWLAKNYVKYRRLIMLDLQTKEERLKIDAGVEHKGSFFKRSEAVLFIESSYNQALSIAKESGKPVYCVDKNLMVKPDMMSVLNNNPSGFLKMKYFRLKHKMKTILNKSGVEINRLITS